jgi:hypothetical protein
MQLEKERQQKQQEQELRKAMQESIRLEKERAKNEIKQRLAQEPAEDDPNATLFVFRLPDGNRISRRFSRDDKISVYLILRVSHVSNSIFLVNGLISCCTILSTPVTSSLKAMASMT